MNLEDPFSILEPEDPFPRTVIQKQAAQRPCAVVAVEAGGHDEAKAAAGAQQRMGLFKEHLVCVSFPSTLVLEDMFGIGIAGNFLALLFPAGMALPGRFEAAAPPVPKIQIVPLSVIAASGKPVAKRVSSIGRPICHGLKECVVFQPG
ncbi:MAG TPA: hypothetical protein PLD73_15685 [Candidatus Hydrogenedentes bacterium]|nr:hypothetical protein [Candidatus Hydrogenedentota bacterium]HPJ98762.1 hypothetical protein [Candidatus Hydrogenedentota bacterium]